MEYVYVVTRPEDGWDCVSGVYRKEEDVLKDQYNDHVKEGYGRTYEEWMEDNGYIVHTVPLY